MKRFEEVLDLLPKGHVFDHELVVLDGAGLPQFNELRRSRPTYVAVNLLIAGAIDLRALPLRERKARLAAIGKRARALDRAHQRNCRRSGRRWLTPILKGLSPSG